MEEDNRKLKSCTICGVQKELTEFGTNWDKKKQIRSYRSACKICTCNKSKIYMYEYMRRESTRARRRAYLKEYNQRDYVKKINSEKAKAYYQRADVQKKRLEYIKRDYVIESRKRSDAKYRRKVENIERTRVWRENRNGNLQYKLRRRKLERDKIGGCPNHKLNVRFATSIYKALKGNKQGMKWELLVGYSLSELKSHLERMFSNGMCWGNYGTYWHVDHIKPKSLFKYKSPKDDQFRECWALKNLQPLEAKKNLIKGNRYVSLV